MTRLRAAAFAMVMISFTFFSARAGAEPEASNTIAELSSHVWLEDVTRHLYRWYIDERDVAAVARDGEIIYWVKELKPKLDEDDHSRFGEVWMPQFSIAAKVKRPDYTISELDVAVKGDRFKITEVEHIEKPAAMPAGFVEVRMPYTEVRDDLFRTRMHAVFPDAEMLDRMRAAVRAEIASEVGANKQPLPEGTQVVFVTALSPVANEMWVYWETGKTLIRFASDIDLANPAMWEIEKLEVTLIRLDKKVVVSLDEVAGGNGFLTRNEAGRALFNCLVLGKRVELQPLQAAPVTKSAVEK
ncbi:MAG: hypothetical protein ACREJD_12970 [Phycisphaerales bacterium]